MKTIFDLNVFEKENELLDLIGNFSKNVIKDLDNKIKETAFKNTEYHFLDLLFESYYSIQSFVLLMKEGLISSASAILRIILEQVSILYILVNNEKAEKRFVDIKVEKQRYYSLEENCKKQFEKEICNRENISEKRIKQYFDYGWYKEANCKKMNLESICEVANTSNIYDMVDEIINGFSHGQHSIYQFARVGKGIDREYIHSIRQHLFTLFFMLVPTTSRRFGSNVFKDECERYYSMAQALYCEIKSLEAEKSLENAQNNKERLDVFKTKELASIIGKISVMLDDATNKMELYLLSQAYVRFAKIIIVLILQRCEKKNCVGKNMEQLFGDLKPNVDYKGTITLNKLLNMLDLIDNKWSLDGSFIDYEFAHSVNSLINALIKYEENAI